MEIRQLEAFAAVYSAGNVTSAARMLDRSQPVVSRQVQDLEHELGFTLFTRTRPQVTLTEQGRQFYEEVHNVLAGLQQLDVRTREIARGRPRPLRVAATFSLASTLVSAVLGRLERSMPVFQDKMSIANMHSVDVVRAVADGQADIGLATLPMDLGRCQLLWSGQAPCLIALPHDHPLASSATVKIADLGDNTVITMTNKSGLRHRVSTALLQGAADGRARRHIEASTYLNGLMLVRAGVGIALVDPFTAADLVPQGVVFRPIDTHVPYMLGVITHRDRVLGSDAQRFIQAMWDYAVECIPRFVPGESNGLPIIEDPFELVATSGPD
jgi:DNA-binding transcriptional LysR family regulator